MLLTVVPHRGSALSIQIIWQWCVGEGRAQPHKKEPCCLLGCWLPPQGNHSKRNKLEGAKTQHCSTDHLLSWLLNRDHNQTSHLKTYLYSPWEAVEFLRTDEEMLEIEKRGIIFSTWEPPLKDPGAFRAHFSVVRWHHFWVQAYACHFTFIIEWPERFQPASPIPILCFYSVNCIKHRVPTCSMRTLDPHRDKSCLILPICKLLWIKPHLGGKKTIFFLTFISRSLTVPR